MSTHAGTMHPRFTARHPAGAFLLLLACFAALFELLAANLAGGWSQWGENILWYRASCFVNDIVLASGAYLYARMQGGPRWWAGGHPAAWLGFGLVTACGAVFLLILARNLVTLYPGEPPMSTDGLSVLYRTVLPLCAMLWVRWRLRS